MVCLGLPNIARSVIFGSFKALAIGLCALIKMVHVIRCRPYFSLPSEEMFGRDFCEPVCHTLIGNL